MHEGSDSEDEAVGLMYTADASVCRRGAPRGYRSGCSTNAAILTA